MRVLCLGDAKIGSVETFEIIDIGFDDDITGIKDEDGNYNRFDRKLISGLYMRDINDEYMYIKGVSLSECNNICNKILTTGYCDLRTYGEYEILEAED